MANLLTILTFCFFKMTVLRFVTIAPTTITRFEQSIYNFDEGNGPAVFVLVLSNPSSTDIVVQVLYDDNTGSGVSTDYLSEAYNVTFPAGVTSVSFSFPIINDNILEDDENFILTIDPSSAPDDVNGGQATVTIVDDDPINVQFEKLSYIIDENDGPAQPVLSLSNPSSTDITVLVRDIVGTATGGGIDYYSTPYNITFPAGVTRVPLSITIIDDNIFESDEIFYLNITTDSLPNGVSVGYPNQTTVTIEDDEFITVMFNQSAYSVNEDDEMLQIVLVLSNSSVTNVTIKLIDNTTTATGGADYKSGPYSVTFIAGQTFAILNISITSDNILERDESFILAIHSPSLPNGVSSDLGQVTVTIVDKDDLLSSTELTMKTASKSITIQPTLEPNSSTGTNSQVATETVAAPIGGVIALLVLIFIVALILYRVIKKMKHSKVMNFDEELLELNNGGDIMRSTSNYPEHFHAQVGQMFVKGDMNEDKRLGDKSQTLPSDLHANNKYAVKDEHNLWGVKFQDETDGTLV
ncbi:extracellular matrix protein 3-like [Dysidea avara]|uniref:extracellular matrix protein 3-like n=1 Tax=Dysidea avara TaxID=196820 RepID=UPI003332327B